VKISLVNLVNLGHSVNLAAGNPVNCPGGHALNYEGNHQWPDSCQEIGWNLRIGTKQAMLVAA